MDPISNGLHDRYTSGAYLDANAEWGENDAEWKAAQIAYLLQRNALRPESICDIGCGTGGVLDSLRLQVPSARTLVGYELSSLALNLAPPDRREHVELVNGRYDSDERVFDLALCLDVFEHVDDYYGLLRALPQKAPLIVFNIPIAIAVTTALRPTPLRRSFEQVGHIHHFTPESARLALDYAGYDVVDRFHINPASRRRSTGVTRSSVGDHVRRLAGRLNIDLAARIMTGFPLLVLAKPR